ncbi:MAG: leucyl aminopeptidase [Acidobacteria bacterium]|nr:leucyl aminopeptidase [Acidobacteriota bacterium]
MELRILNGALREVDAGALVVPAFEKDAPRDTGALKLAGELTSGWVEEVYSSGEFAGKTGEMALLHRPAGFAARRLVLAGGGKLGKFDAAEMRKLAGTVVRSLKGRSVRNIALAVERGDEFAAAAVEGALLGEFETDRYKTDESEKKPLDVFALAGEVSEAALERGRIVGEAQNFTRELANEPGNRLPPSALAARARDMAAEAGLECEILDQDRMRQLGMGALLGVAQGSMEPPFLIVVRYRPDRPGPEGVQLGLVGKGVTFDTGGVSIKPSDKMEEMRADMAGGAAVLGAMRALAALKPAIPVTALVPTVENMPGGRAQRPGDIVRSLAGKTIEILNTDAEGRLILADALAYAVQLGCTHVVDVATLTGAIAVALGNVNAGVFSNHEALLNRVLAAGRAGGEKLWPMPLDEEYREQLKSAFADIQNIGTRYGGAVTAALFLKEFIGETPWVHLDIAGTDWLAEAKPFLTKGPSGVSVRTLIRLALDW